MHPSNSAKPPKADENQHSNSMDRWLVAALGDSRRLLDYCLRHHRTVPPDVIKNVLQASESLVESTMSPEIEARFWQAFGVISKAAAPASAESLRLSEAGGSMRKRMTVYACVTLVTLVVVLSTQVYWLVGTAFLGDVAKYRKDYDESVNLLMEMRRTPAETATVTEAEERLYLRLRRGSAQLQTGAQSLHKWNEVWAFGARFVGIDMPFFSKEYRQLSIYGQALVDSDNAALVLKAIFSYGLPLFYGLLGACVYVLRGASSDIRAAVFTHESASHYFSRLVLGPIAGVAIGWLITPDQAMAPGTSIVHTLGLPALAFVAGYSVEILFVLMDKMIVAIGRSGTASASTRSERKEKK